MPWCHTHGHLVPCQPPVPKDFTHLHNSIPVRIDPPNMFPNPDRKRDVGLKHQYPPLSLAVLALFFHSHAHTNPSRLSTQPPFHPFESFQPSDFRYRPPPSHPPPAIFPLSPSLHPSLAPFLRSTSADTCKRPRRTRQQSNKDNCTSDEK